MNFCILLTFIVLFAVSSAVPFKPISLCANPVQCFVNPCQVSKCAARPDAVCVPNYCGGCHAHWYSNGKRVDCSAASETQVESRQANCVQVNCFVNPCAFAKCQNHPGAMCRANYCGGCNAFFYVDGKQVQCN